MRILCGNSKVDMRYFWENFTEILRNTKILQIFSGDFVQFLWKICEIFEKFSINFKKIFENRKNFYCKFGTIFEKICKNY